MIQGIDNNFSCTNRCFVPGTRLGREKRRFSRIPEFKSPEKSDFPGGDFRILSESIAFVLENEQFLCGLYFLPYTL